MDLPSHCVIDGSVKVHAMVAGIGTAECMFDQGADTLKVTGVLIATNISVLTTVQSVFFPHSDLMSAFSITAHSQTFCLKRTFTAP